MRKMRRALWALLLLWSFCFVTLAKAQSQNVTVQYGVQIGPAHTAQLNWTASVTVGVTSYNVYRSQMSGSGYVKIAVVTAPTVTFTDQGLPAGNTYYYVVTAVLSGMESGYSNQGTGVVPTP